MISAVLIVKNEEKRLRDCLESLAWVDEIVIVDSGSSDNTKSVAREYTECVYERTFDNFRDQKNFAVSKAKGDWILSIDADERVSEELRQSIQSEIQKENPSSGYRVLRNNLIFGKALKYGGQGLEPILRLFKKDAGTFVQPIHEYVQVDGKVGQLPGELFHDSVPDRDHYYRKLEEYTDAEAEHLYEQKESANWIQCYVMPLIRFLYFYILRLGFLDGRVGFKFQWLSAYYYHLKFKKLKVMYKEKG